MQIRCPPQSGMTVIGGMSFHMLPVQQGSVGTSALLMLLPFGGLLVLCCHLLDSAAQAVGLGAFAPRLALAPLIMYIVYSAWARLLGRVPNAWNAVLYVRSLSVSPHAVAASRRPPARVGIALGSAI